jgi:hypothetical protein
MRPTPLLCALALAACGDGTAATPAADLAVPADLSCTSAPGCPTCASGATCVSPTGFLPFDPFCAATCTSSADCASPRTCVEVSGASPPGRYCIGADLPHDCAPLCDLVPSLSRCDGDALLAPYRTIVCGVSYTHCANGCVEDGPDGGADRQARCQ